MNRTVLAVEKMTCGNCAKRVAKAIHALAPLAQVDIDLVTGKVGVTPALVDPDAAVKAVSEAGYPAKLAENRAE